MRVFNKKGNHFVDGISYSITFHNISEIIKFYFKIFFDKFYNVFWPLGKRARKNARDKKICARQKIPRVAKLFRA